MRRIPNLLPLSIFLTSSTFLTRLIFSIGSTFVIFVFFAVIPLSVQASTFKEDLDYANSLRGTVQKTALGFKPKEVFKDQKGGYTDNPPQINHYQEFKSGNSLALEKAAIAEVDKDENYKDSEGNSAPTSGKVVTKAFNTREVFQITPGSEYIKKGKLVKDNAPNVIGGISNKHIDCENKKMSACKTIHVDKDCNEEVRTVRRVCEKTPKVSVVVKDIVYPNCQNMIVTTGWHMGCPSGYSEILYSDMIKGPMWDDIRLCVRAMSTNEGYECYTGYLVQCVYHSSHVRRTLGPGRGTVPKKTHGRIKFSNVYDGKMVVTIVNETTGETLYSSGHFTSGQVVELPFSETQDQTFRFSISNAHYRGVMVLYIDHMTKDRIPNVTWEEVCRDI